MTSVSSIDIPIQKPLTDILQVNFCDRNKELRKLQYPFLHLVSLWSPPIFLLSSFFFDIFLLLLFLILVQILSDENISTISPTFTNCLRYSLSLTPLSWFHEMSVNTILTNIFVNLIIMLGTLTYYQLCLSPTLLSSSKRISNQEYHKFLLPPVQYCNVSNLVPQAQCSISFSFHSF